MSETKAALARALGCDASGVQIRAGCDASTVVVSVTHDPQVNFALFKALATVLQSEAISVRQESGTFTESDWSDTESGTFMERDWSDTEFVVEKVPRYLLVDLGLAGRGLR